MAKRIKSITSHRAEIGSFEKEKTSTFFRYQVKEFNDQGLITREAEFKPNTMMDVETIYEYDDKHNLLSRATYYCQEDTLEKLAHLYDESGRKIADENYFGEDLFEKVIYKYDEKGNAIAQIRMDEDDNEIEKQIIEYSQEGKVLKQFNFSAAEP